MLETVEAVGVQAGSSGIGRVGLSTVSRLSGVSGVGTGETILQPEPVHEKPDRPAGDDTNDGQPRGEPFQRLGCTGQRSGQLGSGDNRGKRAVEICEQGGVVGIGREPRHRYRDVTRRPVAHLRRRVESSPPRRARR